MARNKTTSFNKKLSTRIPIPVWVLLLLFCAGIVFVVVMVSAAMQSAREQAVSVYEEKVFVATHDAWAVRDMANKNLYLQLAKLTPAIVFILALGAAFGLSHGVALVRVEK